MLHYSKCRLKQEQCKSTFALKIPLKQIATLMLPLAINAMRLTGIMPTNHPFTTAPFLYPEHIKTDNLITPLPGIQTIERLIPFRWVPKLHNNGGNKTVLATDGKKLCYLFHSPYEHFRSSGVFASKIATVISDIHFSSERMLNNKMIASRALPGYASSLASHLNTPILSEIIVKKECIPGSGIVDEVSNFVQELDPNIENYGYSAKQGLNDKTGHLTKIDFDKPLSKPGTILMHYCP